MNLFSCSNLNKKYSKGNFSLKDISLELRTGEITGVVGENGNGKTTSSESLQVILRMIMEP
ncbi:MAG: ATP-binding cassette domain-containing protein [Crocinitomicaceae bacterium]|nr:ATP-binding cassette domain-containing protein [Crocinitomicaceae bacterium]